jgi:hypothetical protein
MMSANGAMTADDSVERSASIQISLVVGSDVGLDGGSPVEIPPTSMAFSGRRCG